MRFFVTILSLLAGLSSSLGQFRQTDHRILEEDMRFSAEKSFNNWSLNLGYGSLIMYSDISNFKVISGSALRFGPTVYVSKQLAPALAIDLQYIGSEMYGKADGYESLGDIYFKGNINDISLNGSFFINQLREYPGPVNDRWNFFVKLGVGINLFRSRLYFVENDAIVREDDLNMPSERYMVSGYDPYDPVTKTAPELAIMVPVGFGAMYRISNRVDLSLESSMRFSASDNLDNILTGSTNDRYFHTALSLSYKIGKKDRRHTRWTYRGYGFSLFGRQSKDPLQDEVRRLEEEIAKLNIRPAILRDSVVVNELLTTIYESVRVRNIFFERGASIEFDTEDQVLMAETVVEMKLNPGSYVDLYGYVYAGDEGDQMELSRIQCEKIKDFMVNEMGANAAFIRVKPCGSKDVFKAKPNTNNSTVQRSSRRVDIVFRKL